MLNTLIRKRNKKGFTLAELLIVIAIIMVLVAILIPAISGALDKAQVAADAANFRSEYAVAATTYIDAGTTTTVSALESAAGITKSTVAIKSVANGKMTVEISLNSASVVVTVDSTIVTG